MAVITMRLLTESSIMWSLARPWAWAWPIWPAWLQVCGGRSFESFRYECLYERAHESCGRNQQAHDWRHCCRGIDSLFYGGTDSFLCRGTCGARHHAGRNRGNPGDESASQRVFEVAVCHPDRLPGVRHAGESGEY